MLVIHGEKDFRVPDTQGIATFTALQRRGIESRLVMFPDENHWVLKPANSIYWYDDGARLAGRSHPRALRRDHPGCLDVRRRCAARACRSAAGCRRRSRTPS